VHDPLSDALSCLCGISRISSGELNVQLKTDADGKVTLHPVTGWTTGLIAGMEILMALEYRSHPMEDPEREALLQLGLSVPQAKALAETLNALVTRAIHPEPNQPRQ
jgi:hypothetical protein